MTKRNVTPIYKLLGTAAALTVISFASLNANSVRAVVHLTLTPNSFPFSGVSGGAAPPGQDMTISTGGGTGSSDWTATTQYNWCHVTPISGTILADVSHAIVSVDAPSNVGSFSCVITVSGTNADNSPQTALVTYDVGPAPTPTPTDTPTAVTVSMYADSATISYGTSTVIHWSIANSTSAIIDSSPTNQSASNDPQFSNRSAGNNPAAQDNTSNLTEEMAYTLTAQGPGGPVSTSIKIKVGPAPSGTPIAENTAINPSVACGNIHLIWNAPSSGPPDSYYLYRSTDTANPYQSGSPWIAIPGSETSYDYTPPPTDPGYYYWVASQSDTNGLSALSSPSALVRPTPCAVNFSLSDKVVTAVNAQTYPYTSSCIGDASNPVTKMIKDGDTVSFSIDLCNVGNMDADNVTVTDTGTDLVSPGNYKFNGMPMAGVSYNPSTSVISFGNIGTVRQGARAVITYNATARRPAAGKQNLNRFRNQAAVTYTTAKASDNGGCIGTGTDATNPCSLDTGFLVFFTSFSPSQNEVP